MSRIPRLVHRGMEASRLCLGTMRFGTQITRDESFAVLDRFAELGGLLLDTAHAYAFWVEGGVGVPERLVGEWLRSRRPDGMILGTKGGISSVGAARYPRDDGFLRPRQVGQDLSESLDRLGLDQVPVYYLHRDDPRLPVGEIMGMLAEFVASGRVRRLGASNWTTARLREACSWARQRGLPAFELVQNHWSLAAPSWPPSWDVAASTDEDIPGLIEEDLLSCPWSPLAGGWLAGGPGENYETEDNRAARERLRAASREAGLPVAALALAWLLAKPLPMAPIVGAVSVEEVDQAVQAFDVPPEAVAALRSPA